MNEINSNLMELYEINEPKIIDLSNRIRVKCYPYLWGQYHPNCDIYIYEIYNPNIIKQTFKRLDVLECLDKLKELKLKGLW